jgi:hypothetical protein
MDFIYTDTAKRHLRKIQHECQQLLKKGVFEDEICTHPISVPMFGQGETVSKDEIENLDQMYKYLSREKITVRNLPLRPSGNDGTLDYEFDNEHESFEYITTQDVTVLNYPELNDLVETKVFRVSSLNAASLSHLRGRALTFDGVKFKYHDKTLKMDSNSDAYKYLHAVLVLAKDEEATVGCADVAELCGLSPEGFTKTVKDSLSQTVRGKLERHHDKENWRNCLISTKKQGVIKVQNPKLYKTA